VAFLYAAQHGSKISRQGRRFIVSYDGERVLSVPEIKLGAVVVFGNVSITTPALGALLAARIPVSYFTMAGRLKGTTFPAISPNVRLRLRQYDRFRDPQWAAHKARALVDAKIDAMLLTMGRCARNHPDMDSRGPRKEMERMRRRVAGCADIVRLRGMEGYATRCYFRAFRDMCRDWSFQGRTRRPPRDPVNALLSLTYALMTTEIMGVLSARGLDPYLGFYHTTHYGRPSLAVDMVEEFRQPAGDRFVLSLLNRGQMSGDDFEDDPERGTRLTPDGLRTYFRLYEEWVAQPVADARGESKPYRLRFGDQVARLVRALIRDEPYRPYRPSG
jgi:CRISP-associated protein Cas1